MGAGCNGCAGLIPTDEHDCLFNRQFGQKAVLNQGRTSLIKCKTGPVVHQDTEPMRMDIADSSSEDDIDDQYNHSLPTESKSPTKISTVQPNTEQISILPTPQPEYA